MEELARHSQRGGIDQVSIIEKAAISVYELTKHLQRKGIDQAPAMWRNWLSTRSVEELIKHSQRGEIS